MSLIDYYWPKLPADISQESRAALRKDLSEASGLDLGDTHRIRVSPWVRLKDKEARKANSIWLGKYALIFFKRWLFLSLALWAIAFASMGILIIEIPATFGGFVTGIVALVFLYSHRALNNSPNT